MADPTPPEQTPDVHEARRLFPATADRVYLNTAAIGLASRRLADTYREDDIAHLATALGHLHERFGDSP